MHLRDPDVLGDLALRQPVEEAQVEDPALALVEDAEAGSEHGAVLRDRVLVLLRSERLERVELAVLVGAAGRERERRVGAPRLECLEHELLLHTRRLRELRDRRRAAELDGLVLDDLVQIGCIGLIKAIDRFDIDRGVELTTYATPNIIGEIKRHFRDKGWAVRVPRGLQELNARLSKLVEQLTVEYGRSPTIPELAKAAGAEEEEVLEALEAGRAYTSLSLSQGNDSEDGETLDPLETLGEIEHEYELSEHRAVLEPGFRKLDPRERQILHLRFFDGLTQSQIAQQIGISQMHVSRLIRRALEKIRDEVAADVEA